jgi:hypothetical protein
VRTDHDYDNCADATADAAFYAILTSTQQTKDTALQIPGLGTSGGPGGGPGGPKQ